MSREPLAEHAIDRSLGPTITRTMGPQWDTDPGASITCHS